LPPLPPRRFPTGCLQVAVDRPSPDCPINQTPPPPPQAPHLYSYTRTTQFPERPFPTHFHDIVPPRPPLRPLAPIVLLPLNPIPNRKKLPYPLFYGPSFFSLPHTLTFPTRLFFFFQERIPFLPARSSQRSHTPPPLK